MLGELRCTFPDLPGDTLRTLSPLATQQLQAFIKDKAMSLGLPGNTNSNSTTADSGLNPFRVDK